MCFHNELILSAKKERGTRARSSRSILCSIQNSDGRLEYTSTARLSRRNENLAVYNWGRMLQVSSERETVIQQLRLHSARNFFEAASRQRSGKAIYIGLIHCPTDGCRVNERLVAYHHGSIMRRGLFGVLTSLQLIDLLLRE